MPAIKVNGISIYYELHGEGIPLVLIMGLRRNIEWWYCQIPTLSKQFKVITFDNRGADDQIKQIWNTPSVFLQKIQRE
jgi:pimeloyl-ACP methyl ester carboxylesterase